MKKATITLLMITMLLTESVFGQSEEYLTNKLANFV